MTTVSYIYAQPVPPPSAPALSGVSALGDNLTTYGHLLDRYKQTESPFLDVPPEAFVTDPLDEFRFAAVSAAEDRYQNCVGEIRAEGREVPATMPAQDVSVVTAERYWGRSSIYKIMITNMFFVRFSDFATLLCSQF